MRKIFCSVILFLFLLPQIISAQDSSLKVLVVIAHPDDDATFAGAVYKITHALGGTVDYALITNGEGGYKYSTLAEDIYGLELTEESVGRENLPSIRKKELEAGGKIIGVRNYFYFNQKDHRYTTDLSEILDSNIWNIAEVKSKLTEIIEREKYDFIFTLIPTPSTHAHHSASAIITLIAVEDMKMENKPIVLGSSVSSKEDSVQFIYRGLEGFPLTEINNNVSPLVFDRTQKFGFNDRLDYKIIVNWLIAEHKSQGTMQLLMNRGDYENYWFYDINSEEGIQKTKELFERLKVNQFKKKVYDE